MGINHEKWDVNFSNKLEKITINVSANAIPLAKESIVESIEKYGFALLSGLGKTDNKDGTANELEELASQLGTIIPQSERGEQVEDIRDFSDFEEEKDDRGYRSGGELLPHSDPPTLIVLHCLQAAKSGGESHIVNVRAIHDRIESVNPDLLHELYQDMPQWRIAGEDGIAEAGPAESGRPVFTKKNDKVSCVIYRPYIEKGAEALNQPLTKNQIAALDLFEESSNAPELALNFFLKPGQTLILHNRTVLHARTDFEDWPDINRRRHLLRVWIDAVDLLPVSPEHELGSLF